MLTKSVLSGIQNPLHCFTLHCNWLNEITQILINYFDWNKSLYCVKCSDTAIFGVALRYRLGDMNWRFVFAQPHGCFYIMNYLFTVKRTKLSSLYANKHNNSQFSSHVIITFLSSSVIRTDDEREVILSVRLLLSLYQKTYLRIRRLCRGVQVPSWDSAGSILATG